MVTFFKASPLWSESNKESDMMIGKFLESVFDVQLHGDGYPEPRFTKPLMNYVYDFEYWERIRTHGIVPKNAKIYNLPTTDEKYSKKGMAEALRAENFQWVPKTVFRNEDLSDLKFPIVVKEKDNMKSRGVRLIKSQSELEKVDDWDLAQEGIDIKYEYRIWCWKDKMKLIRERRFDKKLTMKGEERTSIFYSLNTDNDRFIHDKSVVIAEMVQWCAKVLVTEWYAIDIAQDQNDNLWIIEVNKKPGLWVETIPILYRSILEEQGVILPPIEIQNLEKYVSFVLGLIYQNA